MSSKSKNKSKSVVNRYTCTRNKINQLIHKRHIRMHTNKKKAEAKLSLSHRKTNKKETYFKDDHIRRIYRYRKLYENGSFCSDAFSCI